MIVKACQEDPSIEAYIGDNKKAEFNSKIKAIKPLLDKYPSIQRSGLKPAIYKWIGNNNKTTINTNGDNAIDNATTTITQTINAHSLNKNCRGTLDKSKDVSDVSDAQKTLFQADNLHGCSPANAKTDKKDSSLQDINDIKKSNHHIIISDDLNKLTEESTKEIKKDTSDTSNTSANDSKKVIEEEQNILKIRHSESAHIITNDDIIVEEEQCEEVKEGEISKT